MQAVGYGKILDYNDAATLTMLGYAARGLVQVVTLTGPDGTNSYSANTTWYDGTNLSPSGTTPANWAPRTNQQYLSASLYKAGSLTDLLALAQGGAHIDDIKWTIGANEYTFNKANSRWSKNGTELGSAGQYATDGVYFFQTVAPYGVIIVNNVMTSSAQNLTAKFYCTYTDSTTTLVIPAELVLSLQAVVNGQGAFFLNLAQPDGLTIRNGLPASIRLQAEMYANGALDTTSPGTIAWSVYNPATTLWDAISSVAGQTVLSTINGITNGQLQLFDVAVVGTEVYKAVVTRDGTAFTAYATVSDMTDPLQINPGNVILKNGVGSQTLSGRIFSSTGEVDSANSVYNRCWEAFYSSVAGVWRSNPIFSTTATAAVASGATVIPVASVGSGRVGIAVGDTLIMNHGLPTEQVRVVQSISTLNITLTVALSAAVASGAAVTVADKVAGSSTVAAGSSGTTLNVASGTPFVGGAAEAGDIIAVGTGDTVEFRRVTAKATNALTIDKPLKAANYAVGVAVARRNSLRLAKDFTVTEADVTGSMDYQVYVS